MKSHYKVFGKLIDVNDNIIKTELTDAKIGGICQITNQDNGRTYRAQVVGVNDGYALLSPIGDIAGLSTSGVVEYISDGELLTCHDAMVGKVYNGLGEVIYEPIKAKPSVSVQERNVNAPPLSPLDRASITEIFTTGIKTIDGFNTLGIGQRIGIFAGAGVGKTTLLTMLVRNAEFDICVIGLVGERGREVYEFVHNELGETISKCMVVASTSDRPAMERVNAAHIATTAAEYYRDQGKNVLLLIDSITRYGRALREVGLAAGEPPTRNGYPPSVFSRLPKLLERPGQAQVGAITAIYTVLVEGDDMTDPIADESKSILDGHIVLNRALADKGQYPAIDVLASRSRLMNALVSETHLDNIHLLKELMSKYNEVELLLQIGEYKKGGDPKADAAVTLMPRILELLSQNENESVDIETTFQAIAQLVE